MSRYNPTLLTPPREDEEVYPYRRVWQSIAFENTVIMGVAVLFLIAYDFLGVRLPQVIIPYVNVLIAILPTILWLLSSYYRERLVTQPRQNLLTVFIITALAANAIGIPVVNDLFKVEEWLSLESTLNRILGYAITIGITQEIIKYLVLRYIIWNQNLRTRTDMIAYVAASVVGYVTVVNLHLIADTSLAPNIVAYRVTFTVALHMTASMIVGFGLSELHFNPRSVLLMPFMLILAIILIGILIPVRSGILNAGFVLGIGVQNALFGVIFTIIIMTAPQFVIAFLYENAENRQRQAGSTKG
ncbi:MAG: PrsW family glutamic-type intramembrane protease [Aggregatilineales bacterium]